MTNSSSHRLQAQHIAMARKRQRRARQRQISSGGIVVHNVTADGGGDDGRGVRGNGITVNVRRIHGQDEGILYMHKITERQGRPQRGFLSKVAYLFRRRDVGDDNISVNSAFDRQISRRSSHGGAGGGGGGGSIIGMRLPSTPGLGGAFSPPPESETLKGFRTLFGSHQKQYTIASKKKYRSSLLNWCDKHHMNFINYFWHHQEVDSNVYRPSTSLYRYIDWTFTASFTAVFMTFVVSYFSFCLAFGGLLMVAGMAEPNCIVTSGAPFGLIHSTKFSDAFALSWTTFTTVGYGNTYTSTASDLGETDPDQCTWVVFLCTLEAFTGLLFAGMCAAILFGKVNRVQSHANMMFCNAVCLQYEEMEDDYPGPDNRLSERSGGGTPGAPQTPGMPPTPTRIPPLTENEDEENRLPISAMKSAQSYEEHKFVDQFNGCPILKFQVVNELCNREGGELVDCIMKVVGIKFKGPHGRVTHSQYVRVNLVDFEHPFLSRVWHGVHILNETSPLLTDAARQRIRDNRGSWPSHWFDPDIIRSKLEFHDLIVTVAGISNVSAVTVHAYKRYMIGDVLIGYNFAPIVFRDTETGILEVDLSMVNDVREQYGIRGEDLSIRRSGSKESGVGDMISKLSSTIRIKKSKSGDGLGSVTSNQSGSTRDRMPSTFSPVVSPSSSSAFVDRPIGPTVSPLDEEPSTSEDDLLAPQTVIFRSKRTISDVNNVPDVKNE